MSPTPRPLIHTFLRRNSLPKLNELIKTIKIKNPIMQEFMGTHGVYTPVSYTHLTLPTIYSV